jgi:putative transcriptional regulator
MRMLSVAVVLASVLLLTGTAPPASNPEPETDAGTSYLAGQFLVATPDLKDPRFKKSVVYLVDHDASGALGLIVNKVFSRKPMARFMEAIGLDAKNASGTIDLHFGGPVSPTSGFILHSGDYVGPHSRKVGGSVYFTADMNILRAVAAGEGPKHVLFALGYAGWGKGQLEKEMARGDWLVAPATESTIFDDHPDDAWERLTGSAGLPL